MKRILLLGIIIVSLFTLNVSASTKTNQRTEDNLLLPDRVLKDKVDKNDVLSTPAINEEEKIYDFLDYISDGDESRLYAYALEFVSHTTYDIAIVTTDDLGGKEPMDYMYDFYDYNKFNENGIIFMIYKDQNKNKLYLGTTSAGVDSEINKVYTRAYIKGMVEYLKGVVKNEDYYQAANDFIKLGIGIYDIQMSNNGNYRVNSNGKLVKNIYWLDYLVVSIAITSIVVIILLYLNDINKKEVIEKDYLNKSTIVIKKISDERVDDLEK